MYALYIPTLGRVVLYLNTIRISGFEIRMTGYDEDHNHIDVTMNKVCYPEDSVYEYGYCHVISYLKNGVLTPCDAYVSLY